MYICENAKPDQKVWFDIRLYNLVTCLIMRAADCKFAIGVELIVHRDGLLAFE